MFIISVNMYISIYSSIYNNLQFSFCFFFYLLSIKNVLFRSVFLNNYKTFDIYNYIRFN